MQWSPKARTLYIRISYKDQSSGVSTILHERMIVWLKISQYQNGDTLIIQSEIAERLHRIGEVVKAHDSSIFLPLLLKSQCIITFIYCLETLLLSAGDYSLVKLIYNNITISFHNRTLSRTWKKTLIIHKSLSETLKESKTLKLLKE